MKAYRKRWLGVVKNEYTDVFEKLHKANLFDYDFMGKRIRIGDILSFDVEVPYSSSWRVVRCQGPTWEIDFRWEIPYQKNERVGMDVLNVVNILDMERDLTTIKLLMLIAQSEAED